MKKYFAALAISTLILSACDRIDNPISVAKNRYQEEVYGPVPTFPTATIATKNVLVEEFTGHLCGFCPPATAQVLALDNTLGSRMVPVSIHAGTLSEVGGTLFQADYRTPAGNLYWQQLGNGFNPCARIDRTGGLSNFYYLDPNDPSAWENIITSQMNSSTPVELQSNVAFSAGDRKLNVHVNSQFLSNYSGNVNVVVLVLESHIVSPQEDYTMTPPEVEDYEHMHVLRTAVTEPMGNFLASSPAAGYAATSSYTVSIPENWNADHLTVVAYLIDTSTNAVINSIEDEVVN
jgi:Outer membrane protein Omp28